MYLLYFIFFFFENAKFWILILVNNIFNTIMLINNIFNSKRSFLRIKNELIRIHSRISQERKGEKEKSSSLRYTDIMLYTLGKDVIMKDF